MARTSQTRKAFDLHVDVNDLTKLFQDMNVSLKTAVVQTLNIIGRKVNKAIAKDIREKYNIKARSFTIGKTVRLIRADQRKTVPVFTISVLKKGRGLALYSPKRTKAGTSVRIKKGRQTVLRSFSIFNKQKMRFVVRKSRKGGFVDRTSRSGKKYKAAKSEFLYGPSLAQLYGRRKSLKIIGDVIDRDYEIELNRLFNNQFEKKGR
jgi:hypothetical protein